MGTLEFRYKPRPWIMLVAGLFFAGIGGFMAMEDATNERGLVLQRFIHLSPQGATIFYWSIAFICGLFVLAGLAGLVAGLVSKHYVRLTSTELSAPRFAWSQTNTVIPLAEIGEVAVQSIQKERFLNIYHRGGKLSISQSFLPSAAAFEQLREAIVSRARGAS